MHPVETVFFWTALGVYSLGWLALACALVFKKEALGNASVFVLSGGLAAHTGSILARWFATGHGPVMRDFENAMAGGWAVVLVTLIIAFRRPAHRALGTVTLPAAVTLMGYGLTLAPVLEPLSPALKTPWMYVHVSFSWIAFGAFTAASGASLLYLVRHYRLARACPKEEEGEDTAQRSLRHLDELQFRLILYGFLAAAVMIASGSIWARLLWGSYWGWDPVETWSLASWLVYGLYIHLRVVFKWKGPRAAWFALFAVIPVFISFWGVGFLLTSRHLFSVMDMVSR
jgi:cytochrome c-type biogenesis protein CcsB